MTSSRVMTILEQLQAEESELKETFDHLRAETKMTEVRLSQIRKAISSLKGKSSKGAAKSRDTATKEQVLTSITHMLRESGSVAEDDLKRHVEKRLKAEGTSLVGFAMRFKTILQDERFVQTGNHFALRESTELS